MRTLSFGIIRWNPKTLFGCLSIALALFLLSSSVVIPAKASRAIDLRAQAPQATFPGTGVGAIPDGLSGTPPQFGAPLVISFAVSGVIDPITDVSIDITLFHTWVGDLDMVLRAPGGAPSHVVVSRIGVTSANGFGSSSDVDGTYNFSDAAVGPNIWTAAAATPVPGGTYRTTAAGGEGQSNPPPLTSLRSTFSGLGAAANGIWTLTIRDAAAMDTGSVTAANLSVFPPGSPGIVSRPPLDFDGDGKTDYVLVRNSAGFMNWFVQRSVAGFLSRSWGVWTSDEVLPGDYDGDGKWDIAVWRSGTPSIFYILNSATGTLQTVSFGQIGDDPRITQDFDADGIADPAIVRNVSGTLTWYIQRSAAGLTAVPFGNNSTDVAIRGDYDGDRKADPAVYRFTTNTFYVLRSSDGGLRSATFGASGSDYRLPADFDGDGKTDFAVWRGIGVGSSGAWYWLQSSNGLFRSLNFGIGGLDLPVPGDYDGDGKSDQAVWRPGSPANFFVNRSTGSVVVFAFGSTSDVPAGYSLQAR